jgi:hypothetical protein
LPVPAAKITTRPFSRWRMARRRIMGSATVGMLMALSTRVWTPCAFQGGLQGQGVDDRGQHAHVVAGRALHAAALPGGAAEDVAAADHDGHLGAQVAHLFDLAGDGGQDGGVEALPGLGVLKGFPAQFEHDPLELRFSGGGSGHGDSWANG